MNVLANQANQGIGAVQQLGRFAQDYVVDAAVDYARQYVDRMFSPSRFEEYEGRNRMIDDFQKKSNLRGKPTQSPQTARPLVRPETTEMKFHPQNSHPTSKLQKPKEKLIMVTKTAKKKAPKLAGLKTRSMPVAQGVAVKRAPVKVSGGNGTISISKRDYFQSVVGSSSTFTLQNGGQGFLLDPADFTMFPWLASVACNFQRFKLRKMRFEYQSESPSSVTGVVMVAFDRNSNRTPPTSKLSMMQIAGVLKCNSWDSVAYDIPCDNTEYWITPYSEFNSPGVPGNVILPYPQGDPRTTNAGIVYIATSATQTSTIGEVWIDYTFELRMATVSLPPQVVNRLFVSSSSATQPFDQVCAGTSVPSLGGTQNITFDAANPSSFKYQYSGPVMVIMTTFTSSASGVPVLANQGGVSIPGASITGIGLSIATTSVTALWVLTGYEPKFYEFQITGLTNLAPTTSNPFKIYILGYDATLFGGNF